MYLNLSALEMLEHYLRSLEEPVLLSKVREDHPEMSDLDVQRIIT
jgi:hypothetical protein